MFDLLKNKLQDKSYLVTMFSVKTSTIGETQYFESINELSCIDISTFYSLMMFNREEGVISIFYEEINESNLERWLSTTCYDELQLNPDPAKIQKILEQKRDIDINLFKILIKSNFWNGFLYNIDVPNEKELWDDIVFHENYKESRFHPRNLIDRDTAIKIIQTKNWNGNLYHFRDLIDEEFISFILKREDLIDKIAKNNFDEIPNNSSLVKAILNSKHWHGSCMIFNQDIQNDINFINEVINNPNWDGDTKFIDINYFEDIDFARKIITSKYWNGFIDPNIIEYHGINFGGEVLKYISMRNIKYYLTVNTSIRNWIKNDIQFAFDFLKSFNGKELFQAQFSQSLEFYQRFYREDWPGYILVNDSSEFIHLHARAIFSSKWNGNVFFIENNTSHGSKLQIKFWTTLLTSSNLKHINDIPEYILSNEKLIIDILKRKDFCKKVYEIAIEYYNKLFHERISNNNNDTLYIFECIRYIFYFGTKRFRVKPHTAFIIIKNIVTSLFEGKSSSDVVKYIQSKTPFCNKNIVEFHKRYKDEDIGLEIKTSSLNLALKIVDLDCWDGNLNVFTRNLLNRHELVLKIIKSERWNGNFNWIPKNVLQREDVKEEILNCKYNISINDINLHLNWKY